MPTPADPTIPADDTMQPGLTETPQPATNEQPAIVDYDTWYESKRAKDPTVDSADGLSMLRDYSRETKLAMLRTGQYTPQRAAYLDAGIMRRAQEDGFDLGDDPVGSFRTPTHDTDAGIIARHARDTGNPLLEERARGYQALLSPRVRSSFQDEASYQAKLTEAREALNESLPGGYREEARKAAVQRGDLPFTTLTEPDGTQRVFFGQGMKGITDDDTLAQVFKAHPSLDINAIESVRSGLRTPDGYEAPAYEIERQAQFFNLLERSAQDSPASVGQALDRLASARNRGGSEEDAQALIDQLDRDLANRGSRGEFTPEESKRFIEDAVRLRHNPTVDEDNVDNNLIKLSTGQYRLPDGVMLRRDLFEKTLAESKVLPDSQKENLRRTRSTTLDAMAPSAMAVIAGRKGGDFLAFQRKGIEAGKSQGEILDDWMADPENAPTAWDRYLGGGVTSFADSVSSLVLGPMALMGSEEAANALVSFQKSQASRRAYGELWGRNLGFAFDLETTAIPLAVDIATVFMGTGATRAAVGTVAKEALKDAATVGRVARTAESEATMGMRALIKNTMETQVSSATRQAVNAFMTQKRGVLKALDLPGADDAEYIFRLAAKDFEAGVLRSAEKVTNAGAIATMNATWFNRSASSTYASILAARMEQGDSFEEARNTALPHALLAGAATVAITNTFNFLGAKGLEKVFTKDLTYGQLRTVYNRLRTDVGKLDKALVSELDTRSFDTFVRSALNKGVKDTFLSLREVGREATNEALEEATDQAFQSLLEQHASGKPLDFDAAIKEAVYAGALGGILGGGVTGVRTMMAGEVDPRTEQAIRVDKLGTIANQLESTGNSPEMVKAIRSLMEQEPPESAGTPAETVTDQEQTVTEQPESAGTVTDQDQIGPVGPTVEGPTVEGPAVEGPTVEGPQVEGPTGPTVEGPQVETDLFDIADQHRRNLETTQDNAEASDQTPVAPAPLQGEPPQAGAEGEVQEGVAPREGQGATPETRPTVGPQTGLPLPGATAPTGAEPPVNPEAPFDDLFGNPEQVAASQAESNVRQAGTAATDEDLRTGTILRDNLEASGIPAAGMSDTDTVRTTVAVGSNPTVTGGTARVGTEARPTIDTKIDVPNDGTEVARQLNEAKLGGGVRAFLNHVAQGDSKIQRQAARALLRVVPLLDGVNIRFVNIGTEEGFAAFDRDTEFKTGGQAFTGLYNHSTRTLIVNTGLLHSRGARDTMLHELLHAASEEAVSNPNAEQAKILKRMDKLRLAARRQGGPRMDYATSDNAEFVSHFWTDPEFRAELASLTPDGETNWLTVLSNMIRQIVNAFKGKAGTPSDVSPELMADMMSLMEGSLGQDARATGDGGVRMQVDDQRHADLERRWKAGDETARVEAEKMVEDAAEGAGYGTGPVWHGSKTPFNEFDSARQGATDEGWFGRGFYFAQDMDTALAYGRVAKPFYLRLRNPLVLDEDNALKQASTLAEGGDLSEYAKSKGHDGTISTNTLIQWVAFSPDQIKSADPFTYDDNGDLIPLSERFNPQSPDIRFQPADRPFGPSAADVRLQGDSFMASRPAPEQDGFPTDEQINQAQQTYDDTIRQYLTGNWPTDTDGRVAELLRFAQNWTSQYGGVPVRLSDDPGTRTQLRYEGDRGAYITIGRELFDRAARLDGEFSARRLVADAAQEEVIHYAHHQAVLNRLGPDATNADAIYEMRRMLVEPVLAGDAEFTRAAFNSATAYFGAEMEGVTEDNFPTVIDNLIEANPNALNQIMGEAVRQVVQMRTAGRINESRQNFLPIIQWLTDRLNAIKDLARNLGRMGDLFRKDVLETERMLATLRGTDVRLQSAERVAKSRERFNNEISRYVTGNWNTLADRYKTAEDFATRWLGKNREAIERMGWSVEVQPAGQGLDGRSSTGISGDGTIRVVLGSGTILRVAAEEGVSEQQALEHIARVADEELIHAAYLEYQKRELEGADDYRKAAFTHTYQAFQDMLANGGPMLQQALDSSYRAYATADGEVPNVDTVTPEFLASLNPGQQVRFTGELVRQLVQMRNTGGITEETTRNLFSRISEWINKHLEILRKAAVNLRLVSPVVDEQVAFTEEIFNEINGTDVRLQPAERPTPDTVARTHLATVAPDLDADEVLSSVDMEQYAVDESDEMDGFRPGSDTLRMQPAESVVYEAQIKHNKNRKAWLDAAKRFFGEALADDAIPVVENRYMRVSDFPESLRDLLIVAEASNDLSRETDMAGNDILEIVTSPYEKGQPDPVTGINSSLFDMDMAFRNRLRDIVSKRDQAISRIKEKTKGLYSDSEIIQEASSLPALRAIESEDSRIRVTGRASGMSFFDKPLFDVNRKPRLQPIEDDPAPAIRAVIDTEVARRAGAKALDDMGVSGPVKQRVTRMLDEVLQASVSPATIAALRTEPDVREAHLTNLETVYRSLVDSRDSSGQTDPQTAVVIDRVGREWHRASDGHRVHESVKPYDPETGGDGLAEVRMQVDDQRHADLERRFKAGDETARAEAERMVEEAAKTAGLNRRGVRFGFYVKGVPLPPSRSIENNFGTGYYVAEDATLEETTASSVSVSPSANTKTLARLGLNPEDVEFRRDAVFVKAEKPFVSIYGGNYSKETADFINAQLAYDSAVQEARRRVGLPYEKTSFGNTVSDLIANGRIPFDSVRGMTGRKGMSSELVVQNPSQIKSADPFTYDDNGKLIPLSERFNPQSPDIRFQPAETVTSNDVRQYPHTFWLDTQVGNPLFNKDIDPPERESSVARWLVRMFARTDDLPVSISRVRENYADVQRTVMKFNSDQVSRWSKITKKGITDEQRDHVSNAIGSTAPLLTAAEADRIRRESDDAFEAIAENDATERKALRDASRETRKAYLEDLLVERIGKQGKVARRKALAVYNRLVAQEKTALDKRLAELDNRTADARQAVVEMEREKAIAAEIKHAAELRNQRDLSQDWLDKNAPELGAFAKDFRASIDEVQQRMLDLFPNSSHPGLHAKIDRSLGIHLVRSYEIHRNPALAEKILNDPRYEDVRNSALAFFRREFLKDSIAELRNDPSNSRLTEDELAEIAAKKVADRELVRLTARREGQQDLGDGADQEIANATDEQLEAAAAKYLDERVQTAFENLITGNEVSFFKGDTAPVKLNVDRFRMKRDLPKEIRDALQEITDPLENATRTMEMMADIVIKTRQSRDIARVGTSKGLLKRAEEVHGKDGKLKLEYRNWQPLTTANPSSMAYQATAGLYAPPEFKQAFDAAFIHNSYKGMKAGQRLMHEANRGLMRLAGTSMLFMTQGSPGYYTRNIVGGGIMAMANGVLPFNRSLSAVYANTLGGKPGAAKDFAMEMMSHGLLNNSSFISYMDDMIKAGVKSPEEAQDFIGRTIDKVTKGRFKGAAGTVQSALDFTHNLAQFTETWYVPSIYMYWKDVFRRAGMTDELKIQQQAAERTKELIPVRSRSPQAVEGFRTNGISALVAPFIGFKTDMMRNTVNTWRYIIRDYHSDNAVLRAEARKRAAAATAVHAGVTMIMPILIGSLMGIGRDEDEAIRAALPSYAKNSLFMPIRGKDSIQLWDFTFMNPYSILFDPVSHSIRNTMWGRPGEIVPTWTRWIGEDIFGENILAGNIMDIRRNKDETTGMPVFLESDSDFEKTRKSLMHVLNGAYNPVISKKTWQVIEASRAGKDAEDFFYTPLGIIAGTIAPIKPRSYRYEDMEYRAYAGLRRANSELWMLTRNATSPAPLDPGSVPDMMDDRKDAARRIWSEADTISRGFQGLGRTKQNQYGSMVRAGFSKKRSQQLINTRTTDVPVMSEENIADMRKADPLRVVRYYQWLNRQPRNIVLGE